MENLYQILQENKELNALCSHINAIKTDRYIYLIDIKTKINYMNISIEKCKAEKDSFFIKFSLNSYKEIFIKNINTIEEFLIYKIKNNIYTISDDYQLKDIPLEKIKTIFSNKKVEKTSQIDKLKTEIKNLKEEIDIMQRKNNIKVSYQLNKINENSAIVILNSKRDIDNFMRKI